MKATELRLIPDDETRGNAQRALRELGLDWYGRSHDETDDENEETGWVLGRFTDEDPDGYRGVARSALLLRGAGSDSTGIDEPPTQPPIVERVSPRP